MIDLLIPVLGRPASAQPLVDSIHAATTVPHTILFVCSRDDIAQIEACRQTGAVVVLSDDGRYAPKINQAAVFPHSNTPSEWVFLGADDLTFHPSWDEAALAVGSLVVGTNDLGNPTVMSGKHATHSLVARDYITEGTFDEPGKLLHEGYEHNFVDNEFIATAKARGVWAFAFDSHVEHNHPFWRKGQDDDIYKKGRLTYKQDGQTWKVRQRMLKGVMPL